MHVLRKTLRFIPKTMQWTHLLHQTGLFLHGRGQSVSCTAQCFVMGLVYSNLCEGVKKDRSTESEATQNRPLKRRD